MAILTMFFRCLASVILFVSCVGLLPGCSTAPAERGRLLPEASAILGQLEKQKQDWNAGNLAGFMETYDRSDHTVFVSGGDVSKGWQTVFERYQQRYANRAAMGTLDFTDVQVTPLGPDTALATGKWRLKRVSDEPAGRFTLLWRKTANGWRIFYDHTSAAAAK